MAMMELAAGSGVGVQSLSVQSTTLDDVFVHYTGRALRDALQEPSAMDSAFMMRAAAMSMQRTWPSSNASSVVSDAARCSSSSR